VLTGIDSFFRCLQGGDVIGLEPPIGTAVDFFDSDISDPIRLAISFRLSESELQDLQADITAGTPQLEEAARTLTTEHCLHVEMHIVPGDSPFSYVKTVELKREGETPRILLGVSPQSARELREVKALEQQSTQDVTTLKALHHNLDQDDWEGFRRLRNAPSPMQYWTRRRPARERLSSEMENHVNRLWQSLESFDAFRSEIAALTDAVAAEIDSAKARELTHPIRTFGGEAPRVPTYVVDLLRRLANLKVHYLRERREPIGRQEAQRLLELKVRRGGIERLQEIQSTVSGLLGVSIDAFEGGNQQRSNAEMDVDNFVVQVNGAGIREALRIVLDVEFGEPDILLVEEPEIHLHPAMETSLMQYLKRIGNRTQVIISTHSTNFLDVAEMRNVYLVSKTNRETTVQLLNPADAEAEIPRELGIRLSSLFMFDRLAFVEGPTDEAVLREWAATLGLNLSYANVGFVPMGGARNFAYFAAERTLAFLSNRQVEIWFVLDRDERDDEEVQRMTRLAGEHPHVVVLERRELENYLLKPRPIAQFIEDKREMGGLAKLEVTAEDVGQALAEKADELKELTIEKRVDRALGHPVYIGGPAVDVSDQATGAEERLVAMRDELDERIERVQPVVESVTNEVNDLWGDRKLDLVPGEELLDLVCRRWDVRYRKERGDGSRLASVMRTEEISDEMQTLLKDLAN